MIREEEVYRIGRLGKTHGVKGEVSFLLDDDVWDRVEAEYLVLRIDGILVPFFMEEYRFKSDANAIVKFEGVETQERARELTGCEVFFPRELAEDEEELTWGALVGFDIIEANEGRRGNEERGTRNEERGTRNEEGRRIGTIAAVDDTTINTLFELEDGTLIPASEDLITDIDQAGRTVTMHLPEGLLEFQQSD